MDTQIESTTKTERTIQNALRASEIRYRRLFETARDGILILDADTGLIVDANPFMVEMLGYSHADFIGKELWEIGLFKDVAVSKAAFLELQDKGYIRYDDLPLKTTTGRHIAVEFVSNVYRVNDDKVIQCNIREITQRKQLEDQLRQSQKLEAIGLLAGGVAHDFNNMLTVILGYCDLLIARLNQNDPLVTDIKQIQRCGEQGANLTHQLLAFSRKQVLESGVLNLNTLVSDLNSMLQRLIGENINLQAVLSPDLGRIKADPGQIEQIIMNLVVNARDAMPSGGTLILETANVQLDKDYATTHFSAIPGPYVMLAVTDSGCGMDKATTARVFEPFFTTKEQGLGTGLGLATVYGIVKQNGGNIWCYSELGHGTTFKIYLPRIEGDIKAVALKQPAPLVRCTETILVAEDEELVRTLIVQMLTLDGYKVIATTNGTEAQQECENFKGRIDLLITDVIMPGISGYQLMQRLVDIRPDIKVLFMSGYTGDSVLRHNVLKERMAFLQKPFTKDSLHRKIREVLDG